MKRYLALFAVAVSLITPAFIFVHAQTPPPSGVFALWGENPATFMFIVDGGEYSVPFNESRRFWVGDEFGSTGGDLYFVSEGGNREHKIHIADAGTQVVWEEEGVYELEATPNGPPVQVRGPVREFFAKVLFPTILYAQTSPVEVIQFTIRDESKTKETEVDPLILQYEPILLMHPNENFLPMNVEAFVAGSSLWDSGKIPDEQLKQEGSVTVDDISVPGSDEWYLSFSDFNPAVARTKYQSLLNSGVATTTYYAFRTEDSFTDPTGRLHEYIVLQYWYFYAFNDWAEHGGVNNHEGDWESVFIFLDKENLQPKYVAYSQHHNKGEKTLVKSYDSVRRKWDSTDIEKEGDQVRSYVALGSHANYPNNGNEGMHVVIGFPAYFSDLTSNIGEKLDENNIKPIELSILSGSWTTSFSGKWGVDDNDLLEGSSGPRGPYHTEVAGIKRFHHPIEWAGIDKFIEKEINSEILAFEDQSTVFHFTGDIQFGSTVSVDKHEEYITFGKNIRLLNLSPTFWDIESSLPNGTFSTEVTFKYDILEINEAGMIERDLQAFYYNEDECVWEGVDSVVDVVSKSVTFKTDHFSQYAIGTYIWEPLEVDTKVYWGSYQPLKGTRESYIRILDPIDVEKFRVVVKDIPDSVALVNNTGTTTSGHPFIDIKTDENEERNGEQKPINLEFNMPHKKVIERRGGWKKEVYVPEFVKFDLKLELQKQLKD